MSHHAHDKFAYLSIITWPEGLDRRQQAELLASTGVIDAPSANLVVARDPPLIAGLFEYQSARTAAARIIAAGGDAFAPSIAELASLGPTMKIRELRIADGALAVEIWRGPSALIHPEHIQILVRGTLDITTDSQRDKRVADRVADEVLERTSAVQYGWAARMAAQRNIDNLREQAASIQLSEKLDIHTTSGTVFQIDGDKFAFTALGDMRGHADAVNMRRMCELLSHLAPDAIVDDCFGLFRAPTAITRLLAAVPALRRNEEDPAFAFYSRWVALMYRHVMGARR